MKKILLTLSLFCAATTFAQFQPFQEGNLVVTRVGDGTADLDNTGSIVFLDEYTPSGVLVRSIELPWSGTNTKFVLTGNNDTEGAITRSPNGLYLTMIGYDANFQSGSSVLGSNPAVVNRVIATLPASGVPSYVLLNDYPTATGQAVRSVVTTDGQQFWIAGGTGVAYKNAGSSTTTVLATITAPSATASFRTVTIADGNLYASTTIGTNNVRIGQIGSSGLPTDPSFYNPLPGIETSLTPHQFVFADLDPAIAGNDVMYIADERSNSTSGGIRKYSLVNDTWIYNGRIGTQDKYRAIAISVSGTSVTIFAVSKGGNSTGGGGAFVTAVDNTGYNADPSGTVVTELAAVNNTSRIAYRGVAYAPVSSPLPISIKSFNAGVDGGKVNIWWSTINEVNVKDFTIERSLDASSFERVGTVAARNSNQLSAYSYTDAFANAPVLYYRLKVTDKDGSITYSSVIKVNLAATVKVVVAPNPATGSTININHAKAGKDAVIRLFNIDGKILCSIPVQQGATQSLVDVAQLVKGSYIIEFADNDSRSTATFIKQ